MFCRLRLTPLIRLIPSLKTHEFSSLSPSIKPQNPHQNRDLLASLLTKQPLNHRLTHQIHAQILTSSLIFLYPLSVLFNPLLRQYTNGDFPRQALSLFRLFRKSSLSSPHSLDSFTYLFLLKACANLGSSMAGIQLHSLVFKVGFHSHVYVQTGLITMYVSTGFLEEARQVFDEMSVRNSMTWNAIVTGLAKGGDISSARLLFLQMPARTVEAWSAIIDAHTRRERYEEAVSLFREMVSEDNVSPSEVTLLAIFPAVSNLGDLKICQSFHSYGEKQGFVGSEIRVANSLMDSYWKCGCIRSATRLFEEIPVHRRNLISWSSVISGLAMHGEKDEAFEKFNAMEEAGVKPNEVTFISILNGCSHGGLVEEGIEFFLRMVEEFRIEPNIMHFGCLVDMLGRAGRLEEAERVALRVPSEITNVVIWRTLLAACKFHDNVEMAERVMAKILDVEKKYGGDYVSMSNIFSSAGRYVDSEKLRCLKDERSARKVPAFSTI